MENNYFDKLIRAKLENLEASQKAEGWELLQHRMAADPELNGPEDATDPIDEIVKSKLEDTNAVYEPGSWAMMENKINADVDLNPQMDDVVFDGVAYENLNNLETPYNSSHWELMAKRIQEEFSLHHRLYKYKVAEISLMLFAIFTLLQFLPIDKISIHKNNAPVVETETTPEVQQAIASFPANEDVATESTSNQATNNAVANNATIAINNSPITTVPSLATAEIIEQKVVTDNNKNQFPDFTNRKHIGTSVNPPLELDALLAVAKVANQDVEASSATSGNQDSEIIEVAENNLSITVLLNLESSPMEELIYDDAQQLPQCVHCKRKKPIYFKTGMMIATDLNYVMTPYDSKFEENSYATLSAGYTGGLSFGVQQGRWEIGTAVLYSAKRYEPKPNVEYTGSLRDGLVGEGLKSAQLNILSIPLNANYTYTYAGKWHLYAVAGGSANMAAVNHYDFKKFSVGSSRSGSGDPRIVEQHADETPTYKGIFEGGDLSDNLYFTVNLGLGAERYFSPRWSVFIQPVYQHSVFAKGLGPNNDRFNTFTIFAGAKATLR